EFFANGLTNVVWQGVDLGEALSQAVGNMNVLAAQLPHQFHVVVAWDAKRRAPDDHVADDPNSLEDTRSTVHEVAHEHRLSAQRVCVNRTTGKSRSTWRGRREFVTQLTEQCFQFVAAAVYVPDDVEGAVFVALVVIKRH